MGTKKYKVGLVQINNSFSGQNYFPYSIGMLRAYANQHCKKIEEYNFLLPIYKRIPVKEAVKQLQNADIVFFSLYVWNFQISLRISEQLKEINPGVTIVYGGPHVPDEPFEFMQKYPFVNLCVRGEGEVVFNEILENYSAANWSEIQSLSYFQDNKYHSNPKRERIKDIEEAIPSPYLSGVFDDLIKANPEEKWLGMWETNRGCPFSCTYCDWGSATQSKVNEFGLERLFQEVDWFANQKIEFIFCADANFGIKKRDMDIAQYVKSTKEKTSYPHALSVQNTKNSNDRTFEIQKVLEEAGLNKGVTLSAQTMDSETLENVKRKNIPAKNYHYLQKKFSEAKIETYADLILALPGETYETFLNGICSLIENGQHNRIQFNNLSILPNAEMGNPEYQKKFGMEMIETKIINIHGHLNDEEEVSETQILVVGTNTMDRNDWVKTRALSWMTAFIYFDKIMQIPLLVLKEAFKIPIKDLLQIFIQPDSKYPALNKVYEFFRDEAIKIQNGGPEFCNSQEWLNIWWPHDEYMFIKVVKENLLDDIYSEASLAIKEYSTMKELNIPEDLLISCFALNKSLIKTPLQKEDFVLETNYNIWEYYNAAFIGAKMDLKKGNYNYKIDRTSQTWNSWPQWYKEVVWYGNKKGAYLYSAEGKTPKFEEVAISSHH